MSNKKELTAWPTLADLIIDHLYLIKIVLKYLESI